LALDFLLRYVGILYLYWIGRNMPMLEYDVRRIEIDDVDLSKSITNPFDPLLIVRDPYNSRIIKELY